MAADLMPDHPKALCIHFLAHGVHHFLPMDQYVSPAHRLEPWLFTLWSDLQRLNGCPVVTCSYRLVMPPALFTLLSVPTLTFFNMFLPYEVGCLLLHGHHAYWIYTTVCAYI